MKPSDREYWYNKDKYVILGFSKCGTTSLSRWLHCSHPEIGYSGTEEYLKNYSKCRPVFILRNPVDRIWSMYCYHGIFKRMSFEEMLNFKSDKYQNVGCNDCIEQSDYLKYIEPFKQYDPIIYRLEFWGQYMEKDWRGTNTKKIPKEFRKMIEERLKDANIYY